MLISCVPANLFRIVPHPSSENQNLYLGANSVVATSQDFSFWLLSLRLQPPPLLIYNLYIQ